jgi:hypothetical protein
MGRIYYVDIAPTAITVAADLVELTPADDKPIVVHGFETFQTTDLGDAQEEIIGLLWVRGHTTSGSGGLTPTPRPANPSDAAAGFTVETVNTTQASAGTAVNLPRHGWNVRVACEKVYTPETRPQASQANTTLVLRMAAAPADSLTISGYVIVEELG